MPIRYLIAASIMVVCSALQAGLQVQAGFTGFFLLLPGVYLSGLLFDRDSGLLAAAIAVVVTVYLSYAGRYGMEFLLPCALFSITAVGVAMVAEVMRGQTKRVLQANQGKTLLLEEMAHRTKNNPAILSAIVRLQARSGEPACAEARERTAGRIQVMAEVYDHLSPNKGSRSVDMRRFLSEIVEKVFSVALGGWLHRIQVICDDCHLSSQEALAIGVVRNELVTNAVKYAFPEGRSGQVVVVELKSSEVIEPSVRDKELGSPRVSALASFRCSRSSLRARCCSSGSIPACVSCCGLPKTFFVRLMRRRATAMDAGGMP